MQNIYFDDLYIAKIGNIQAAVMSGKLVCVAINKTIAEELAKLSVNPVKDSSACKPVIVELNEYFSRKRKIFSFECNFLFGTDFQKKVWNELANIPYGKTISYKELAARIGNPNASRAVGNANSKNPIPIIIPCHRVIASDSSLGGFSGGLNVKEYLLKLENDETL